MAAPVGHTCNDIDRIIDSLRDIINEMEDIRSANSALRDWGTELEDELEGVKDEKYYLERDLEEANSELEKLHEQIMKK